MAKSKKTIGKMPALITYIIAVAALIAGLILPLDTLSLAGGINFAEMPVLQVFGALKALGLNVSFGAELTPPYNFIINVFNGFNLGALLLVLYAAVTVFALVALIPVCVAKKKGDGARKLAVVTELIALTVLGIMVVLDVSRGRGGINLSVLIPCGVTFLALAVQSVIYMGGSGVIKIILFVFSLVSVMFAVCDAGAFITPLKNGFEQLASSVSGAKPFDLNTGLFSVDGVTYSGAGFIGALIFDRAALSSGGWALAVAKYLTVALLILVSVNLYLDLLGLGKRTKKFMLFANLIRYIAEFVLLIALFITVFAVGGNFGIALYILALVALIQLIIQIIRFAREVHSAAKKPKKADAPVYTEAEPEETEEEFGSEAYTADPAAAPAVAPRDGTVFETHNVVYNINTIYNGPTDAFIKKLTSDEKVEFAKVFLERRIGNLQSIPDYVVGGDNSKFFSMVFIYFARVRDVVSDGLMNKLYEEVNSLNT